MEYVEPRLKACPFCGSTDVESVYRFEKGDHFIIACQECGARSSPCLTEHEAVKMWNKRMPERFPFGSLDLEPKKINKKDSNGKT